MHDHRLIQVFELMKRAFPFREDSRSWAEVAIAAELCDETKSNRINHSIIFYSSIYFGGDVVRMILEHPVADAMSAETVASLNALCIELDGWRRARVAIGQDGGDLDWVEADPG